MKPKGIAYVCILIGILMIVNMSIAEETTMEARPTIKVLAIGKVLEGATPEKIGALVQAEAKRAWELYMAGIFREVYFRTDAPLPVVIMECKNIEEAKAVIATLPMVKAGLTDFDLMPLGPFGAFMSLFAKE